MRSSLLAVLLAASASAQSTVVFGNLGSTGTGNISATNTDIGTDYDAIALLFTTPVDQVYSLNSVTVGVFFDNALSSNFQLTVYNGLDNSVLAVSSPTSVGVGGKYTFNFTGTTLAAGTTYSIHPEPGLSWYAAAGFATPTQQNGSGFAYVGTSLLADSTWSPGFFPYSVSITASPIPEPSTYGLILGGLALAGAAIRRRQKAAK